jgi:hypothetical protein
MQNLATWRDADDNIVASVYGDTICENPVLPRDLAATTPDGRYECALPCRKCGGCRRFQRLKVSRRLAEYYKEESATLWQVTILASSALDSSLIARLSRTPSFYELLGFCRLGVNGYALIVRGRRPNPRAIPGLRQYSVTIRRVSRPGRARAWRGATRGLLVSRSKYGPQVKRFYFRGMPQLSRELMDLQRKGGVRKRHPEAKFGFRAWRDGLTLYPSANVLWRQITNLVQTRRSRRECAFDLIRRRAQRAVSETAMTGFRDAAVGHAAMGDPSSAIFPAGETATAASAILKTGLNSIKAGRDASSSSGNAEKFAEWGKKMAAKARARAPDG